MKFIKSKFFIFILGGIFFSSITAFAVTKISADKITYTDKNNVEKTVDVVLDDLYTEANKDILSKINLSNNKITTVYDYGIGQIRNVDLNLEKGSYLIMASEATTFFNNSNPTETTNNTGFPSATATNGTCTAYLGRWTRSSGKQQVNNSNLVLLSRQKIHLCTLNTAGTITITSSNDSGNVDNYNTNLIAQAIKLD